MDSTDSTRGKGYTRRPGGEDAHERAFEARHEPERATGTARHGTPTSYSTGHTAKRTEAETRQAHGAHSDTRPSSVARR